MGKKLNLEDLNKHIFDALDRLAKVTDEEELKTEIQRCNAVTNAGKTIVEEIKVGVEIAKLQEKGNDFADCVVPLLGFDDEE